MTPQEAADVEASQPLLSHPTLHPQKTAEELAEDAWLASLQLRPWHRRPSVMWLIPFLFLFGLLANFINSPSQQLVIEIICEDYLATHDVVGLPAASDPCKSPVVLSFAAKIISQMTAIQGVLTLLAAAHWTSMSDRHGRKILLHICLGTALSSVFILLFAASSYNPYGYRILYLDSIILGVSAGQVLGNPAIFAYIADCTRPEFRSVMIGYALTSVAAGGILGPTLGGLVERYMGLRMVVKISAVAVVILQMYLCFIPESLRKHSIVPSKDVEPVMDTSPAKASLWSRLHQMAKRGLLAVIDPLLLFVPGEVPVSDKMPSPYTLCLILLANQLMEMSLTGASSLFIPFTNLVFGWTAYEDGFYFTYSNFLSMVTFVALFPLAQQLYRRAHNIQGPIAQEGNEDEAETPAKNAKASVRMDLTFFTGGLCLRAIAYTIVPLYLSVPTLCIYAFVATLSTIAGPSSVSLLTTLVPAHQTGKALGAITVLDSIGGSISVLAYAAIFEHFSSTMPGFYFYVSAAVSALGCVLAYVVRSFYRKE